MKIISGFPCIGKSHYCEQNKNLNIADSDSSQFSWLKKGIRHPAFPQNYIDHIKEIAHEKDIILISTHKVVRQALVENKMYFTLIFPERHLKLEYIKRCEKRENNQDFITMLDVNWDLFMSELENQKGCIIVRLKSGEFLSDYLDCQNDETTRNQTTPN